MVICVLTWARELCASIARVRRGGFLVTICRQGPAVGRRERFSRIQGLTAPPPNVGA